MNSENFSTLIQVITSLAVLAGIALVVWELRQTRQIALGQINHDGYALIVQNGHSFLGETFGDVYAKACTDPSALTPGEIVKMRSHFDVNLAMMRRIRNIQRTGGFDYSWEQIASGYIAYWLDSEIGREHYALKLANNDLEEDIKALAEEYLSSHPNADKPCNDLETLINNVGQNQSS